MFIVGLGSQVFPEGATREEKYQIDLSRTISKGMSYDDVIRKLDDYPTYVLQEKRRIGKHNIIAPKWIYQWVPSVDGVNFYAMFWFVDGRVQDIKVSRNL